MGIIKAVCLYFINLFKPTQLRNPECCHDCADKCAFSCVLNKSTCDNHKCVSGSCEGYTSK